MSALTRSFLAAAACVLCASLAQAQSDGQRNGQHKGQQNQHRSVQKPHAQPPQQAHRPGGPDYRPRGAQQARPPAYRPEPVEARGQRGAGPNHDWYRGARMPAPYRTHDYVVDDWRDHHLSAPPRGYYWVQNGGDYLLIAIASGVIAQIILGD